jgi:hypothetical protein
MSAAKPDAVDHLLRRAHVRGSVEAWAILEKARQLLLSTSRNAYVDYDVVLSICEDIATEQDRLIELRPREAR